MKRNNSVTSLKNKSHIEHLKGYIEKLKNEY